MSSNHLLSLLVRNSASLRSVPHVRESTKGADSEDSSVAGYKLAHATGDLNKAGDDIANEVEETLDEAEDCGENGVYDGIECVEDGGEKLVD